MSAEKMVTRVQALLEIAAIREKLMLNRAIETISIEEIDGRILAEPIVSEIDLPSENHATMDGYAINANEEYPLELVDMVFPEDFPEAIAMGQAVRISTGAVVPEGANAVLKREDAIVNDNVLEGLDIESGTYIYAKGSNVSKGETLFDKGACLAARDAILLLDLGHKNVKVYTRFSVGILATGTEIYEGKHEDLDSAMLCGLVASWGGVPTYEGSVPDEYDIVEKRIEELSEKYDVVVTTGGTSVGKRDYVVKAISNLGGIHFQGVLVRPGKPVTMASIGNSVIFAVPGKPIGAHTVAILFLRPFFRGIEKLPTIDMKIARKVKVSREGFEYIVPVVFGKKEEAMPLGHVDSSLRIFDDVFNSSVLSSSTRAVQADGFFIMTENVERGSVVKVVPYTAIK